MSWSQRIAGLVAAEPDRKLQSYRSANAEMIRGSLLGYGPDSRSVAAGAGMRVVFNMSSAHVPAFFAAGPAAPRVSPYQNRYDRAAQSLGDAPPTRGIREKVDAAVAATHNAGASPLQQISPEDIYYGAVELNGPGIRYFGDVSLVVKPDKSVDGTLVLYRNSYDLSRKPVVEGVYVAGDEAATLRNAQRELNSWAGLWPRDPPEMAACKILEGLPATARRLTTGMVSAGVLVDEDYLEVIRIGSFGYPDLEEMRLTAADAAAEARIADRIRSGPAPSFAEMLWRYRRRESERAAARQNVRSRVIVTAGRDRG